MLCGKWLAGFLALVLILSSCGKDDSRPLYGEWESEFSEGSAKEILSFSIQKDKLSATRKCYVNNEEVARVTAGDLRISVEDTGMTFLESFHNGYSYEVNGQARSCSLTFTSSNKVGYRVEGNILRILNPNIRAEIYVLNRVD